MSLAKLTLNSWRGLKDLPKEIWILSAATLVNRAGTMALPFLVLYLTRALAMAPPRAAFALTVYGIASFVAMPVAGRLSDHFGPLTIIKISFLFSGVSLLIYPLARNFASILVITFLWGVLNESVRPPSLSIISDATTAAQRKPAFALNRLAINLGMSIGPAIAGILAHISFRLLFFIDGATSIVASIVVLLAPWPQISPASSRASVLSASGFGGAEELGRELEAQSIEPLAPSRPVADLRAFRDTRMLYFLAAVIIVALEVPLNAVTARWVHHRTLALGAILYAIGFGSFGLVTRVPGIVACVVVWTFGEMIFMPGSAAYASEIAPAARRGEYMGLYTMSFSIAFSAGPWIGVQVLQRWGPHILSAGALASGSFSTLLLARIPAAKQS